MPGCGFPGAWQGARKQQGMGCMHLNKSLISGSPALTGLADSLNGRDNIWRVSF